MSFKSLISRYASQLFAIGFLASLIAQAFGR